MTNNLSKKILIAPLDWGLGHASRCIPLITYLQKKGCEIIIAADGPQLSLLEKEFPGLKFIRLKGYTVNYSRYKRLLGAKILWQIPKILLRIRREYIWLEKIIVDRKIDLVISDNRYGLYSKQIPCIFITHQLNIKTPFVWLEGIVQKLNYNYISRFTECWVPDFEGEKNIAGALSHPAKMPEIKTTFLGPLSRFNQSETENIIYKYLFVLSGPEPQRTVFEEKVNKIIPQLQGKIIVVRGKPQEIETPFINVNVTVKNHLSTTDMQQAFLQSEYIISRSGYTIIMELLSLKKKSILIPTPGQTEQEYLAAHLMNQHWCYVCKQEEDLFHHIQLAAQFNYQLPQLQEPVYEKVINEFLDTSFGIS